MGFSQLTGGETVTALILAALIANPERYKYIARKIESGELSQEEATQKNIDKAVKITEQFFHTTRLGRKV